MKRKSIFLTIVALFVSGWAMAQTTGAAFPDPTDPLPTGVKEANTIYFCATADSLYPIELGYDVNGRNLSPSLGKWTLHAKSDVSATASDFDFSGNGGSGNAFKVVASSIGGYLFQYEATDAQCGLPVGDKYWAFVFILPDAANSDVVKDTVVCPDAVTPDLTVDVAHSFPYTDLYKQAGIDVTWNPLTFTVDRSADGVGTTYRAVGRFTKPTGYSCPDSVVYILDVKVTDLKDLKPINVPVCANDTAGSAQVKPINDFFKRPNTVVGTAQLLAGQGRYTPADLQSQTTWTSKGNNVYHAVFRFDYKDCTGNTGYVDDTLVLRESPLDKFWDYDTATVCRTTTNINLVSLHNSLANGKPILDATSSFWNELGRRDAGSHPDYTYFTPDGTWDGLSRISIDPTKLSSNIGYHYQWQIDASANCFAGDSGRLVIILQDPFAGKDYAGQLCGGNNTKTNLEQYTGITGATWHIILNGNPTAIADATNADVYIGTNIYTYKTLAGCGVSTTNKVYIKNTAHVKIPATTTVKFCITKLPSVINLNEVLGVIDGVTWSAPAYTNVTANAGGYNAATGIIDIGAYSPSLTASSGTATFTATGGTCVPTGTTVIIEFVTAL